MADKYKYTNKQIKNAGYFFCGHYNIGALYVEFENGRIEIPKNQLNKFFRVLNVDAENGIYFETIKNMYCRVITDENLKIVGIAHIVSNNIFYFEKEVE